MDDLRDRAWFGSISLGRPQAVKWPRQRSQRTPGTGPA